MKSSEVKAGMSIRLSGYEWTVTKATYDPNGNTGNQPRMIFTCDAIGSNLPPEGYRIDCSLGRCIDAEVEVIGEMA